MPLIVFAASGCPAGWLGAYGNEWVATPHLDRLAAEGTVFDRHLSDAPDPAAARRTWRAGFPAGVRTAIVRASRPENDGPPEFYAGWDEVFDARPGEDQRLDPLAETLPGVLDSLAGHSDWLLWVEFDAFLPPWDVPDDLFEEYVGDLLEDGDEEPPEPWDDPPAGPFDRGDEAAWQLLHRSFAAAVTLIDAGLGRVFDVLRDRGLGQTATWAFTADYGYPLGEHGQVGVGAAGLHEELVHLPLIVRRPAAADAGGRVPGLTTPADVLPILLGQPVPERSHVVTRSGDAAAVRTPEWAYLGAVGERPAMLFAKPEDRWEVNDLRGRQVETADELEAVLRGESSPSEPERERGSAERSEVVDE